MLSHSQAFSWWLLGGLGTNHLTPFIIFEYYEASWIIFKDLNPTYFWVNDSAGPETQLPVPVAQKWSGWLELKGLSYFWLWEAFPGLTLTLLEVPSCPFCLISCLLSNGSRLPVGPCHAYNCVWVAPTPVSNSQSHNLCILECSSVFISSKA